MRKKVERNCKQVAEHKLNISLTSPKVVLNASDCAKFLGGMGRTSVLLVEKKGKMVAASSRVQTRSTPASTSVVTSSLSRESLAVSPPARSSSTTMVSMQTKICNSSATLIADKSSKLSEESASAHIKFQSSLALNSFQEDQNKSTQTKFIMKPPKKRRGSDKRFEEDPPADIIIKNGSVAPTCSPPSVCFVTNSPSQISPPQGDISNKHSIEQLLQYQKASPLTTNNNKTTLVPGSFSLDCQSHNLPQGDLTSSSVTSAALTLSSSSPNISDINYEKLHHTELYAHSCIDSFQGPENVIISQPQNSDSPCNVKTREHSPSLPLSNKLSATKAAHPSGSFQHLPEQLEPMNLSTSCKPVVNLHSHKTLSDETSKASTNDSATLLSHSNVSVCHMANINETVEVKQLENPQITPHPMTLENQKLNFSDHKSVVSDKDNMVDICEFSKNPDSLTGLNILSETVMLASKSHPEETTSGPFVESIIPSLVDQTTHASSPPCVSDSPPSITLITSSPKVPNLAVSQDFSIKTTGNNSPGASEEPPSGSEREVPLKVKRPKKKIEIPMDEVSRAERTHRYSLTVNDVVTNFVFVPEPNEECLLTEEEEAAIRDQFEDAQQFSAQVNIDDSHDNICDVIENVSSQIPHTQPGSASKCHKSSGDSETVNCVNTPKKGLSAADVKSLCLDNQAQAVQSVNNIDSVLAFVAGDVLNSSSVFSSSGDLHTKKHKKVAGKLQQTGTIINKNKKGNSSFKITNTFNKQDLLSGDNHVNEIDSDNKQNKEISSCTNDKEKLPGDTFEFKSKKGKKRKSDTVISSTSQSSILPQSLVEPQTPSLNLPPESVLSPAVLSPNKKKKTESKTKSTKKRKSESKQKVNSAGSVTIPTGLLVDKEVAVSNRAETSDIGESIASTSGGSEQDTPVHEPESKDEMVGTDSHVSYRENHDTGLESGEEDTNKPVSRYKKRLDFVKCDHCDHQARGRSALSRHMKKVHMLDISMPYKCDHCEYGCTKMASLNRHLFTHGVFPCSRCNFKADERIGLTQHVMEEHKDKLNMKLCKICNRYIKCDQITIEQHVQECQGPTPFKCTECQKEFRYASSLRVHYHTHFPNQPKRFGCGQCEYRTNYKANLHKHHKNMHASRDREVQCPDCGKLFSTEDNMRRHRKVHTLIRPFACDTCEKTFKTSGALKGHQLSHTATRPYSCNFPGCSRSFRTAKFMKSHQEEFHRLVPKKFFCMVEGCNYSFFKRSHLKRHSITHTGERNYHCTWPGCSKSFRHADNLKVHFRSHTNEKPVQCHLCDFKCKQKNSLFWHKKKVHQVIDVLAIPKRTDHKLKLVEAEEKVMVHVDTAAKISLPEPAASENNVQTRLQIDNGAKKSENVALEKSFKGSAADTPGEGRLSLHEQNVGTQTAAQEDLYEFKSDGESEEEAPGHYRRDKAVMSVLTPLPPPPKELLYKIEIQEMKEKEKKEKVERKEQERIEKAERKNLEKREKAEKKELEKKEKAERKECEIKDKIKKKELEKKEKLEKRELEKKEKIEKIELEKKQKEERREQEKKEKLEKKEQERKEKIEKKEKEKKEKIERKEHEKREKSKTSVIKRSAKEKLHNVEHKVVTEEEMKPEKGVTKKSTLVLRRNKSPVSANLDKLVVLDEKPKRGRKTLKENTSCKSKNKVDDQSSKENEVMKASMPRRRAVVPRKPGEASARAVITKISALRIIGRGRKKGRLLPPKRKPSARIKARKKATEEKVKSAEKSQKTLKEGLNKKSGRKKALPKTMEVEEVKKENDESVETNSEESAESLTKSEEDKKLSVENQEMSTVPLVKPSSPAYSEEIMLQGKASPYRDFSDSDNGENDEADEKEQIGKLPELLPERLPESPDANDNTKEDTELQTSDRVDASATDRLTNQPIEEDSDNEVSNDIPLTPPRAPAPPPLESSEDEMELEPEHTPISVPGPNTPFSVQNPHTPFSVPPPTNLMQQHSVHSDETPLQAISSVPSLEMHSQGSVDVQQSLGSVEMHSHGSVEMSHPHGSVDMHHSQGSVDISHPHGSMKARSHNSVEIRSHGSVELQNSHRSVSETMIYPEQNMPSMRTPESNSNSMSDKYDLPQSLQDQSQASEADKEFFDQYLRSLSAANNRAASGGLGQSPSGLQQLEAMVCKSHLDSRDTSRSPISSLPISVITSLESSLSLLPHGDIHSRMDALVSDRHHESFYARETASSLPRLPDRQTPLPPSHPCSTPSFDAFSSLNPLHSAATGGREAVYLRQPEKLFPTPPSSSSFMAEAMFQRQAMTTPFLPPQPTEKNSLSRIPDTTPLRSSTSSSLLRRSGTVQDSDMFSPQTMARAMPRHPFANAWTSQEARPAHWQTPYLPRQPNMATASSFFPTKENYLMGRNFMFDPSARPTSERNMFPSLSSSQSQDSFQLDRFDLSNYFPNAMTPYSSSTGTLNYSRTAHAATTKPFDDRYRQTAVASAAISDFRGLPTTGGSTDMFPGLPGVNSSFNIYQSNPMSYHAPHMTDNVNSAFLTHPSSAQHAMFERDYAAAAAHRGLYSQNTPYSFIDERQYSGASKLAHAHSVPTAPVLQERDIMSRSSATESQMQDPYRSMLYRY